MPSLSRLALIALAVGGFAAPSFAQDYPSTGHRWFNRPPMTAEQVSNHLYGYYAGNHKHGGYGYGGGAGYGYGGGSGGTYNGGFFFPGYGNTYGLYSYGSGYNYSSPNYAPPAALTTRYPLAQPRVLDPGLMGAPVLPAVPAAPILLPAPGRP